MLTTENTNFKMGLRDGVPICVGYIPVSFAFGMFATSQGLTFLEALLISMLNVTSAGQLAAVPIIALGGGFFELGLTQLVINMRYSLMSVSLSQRFGESVRLRDRFIIAFVNTDEVFAMAMSKEAILGRSYLFALILTPFIGWTVGTALGAAAGNILPEIVSSAIGIAIYAMFLAILIPAARADKNTSLCILLSAALSCLFFFVPGLNAIPSGFIIIICTVCAGLLFALVAPIKDGEGEENA